MKSYEVTHKAFNRPKGKLMKYRFGSLVEAGEVAANLIQAGHSYVTLKPSKVEADVKLKHSNIVSI